MTFQANENKYLNVTGWVMVQHNKERHLIKIRTLFPELKCQGLEGAALRAEGQSIKEILYAGQAFNTEGGRCLERAVSCGGGGRYAGDI